MCGGKAEVEWHMQSSANSGFDTLQARCCAPVLLSELNMNVKYMQQQLMLD